MKYAHGRFSVIAKTGNNSNSHQSLCWNAAHSQQEQTPTHQLKSSISWTKAAETEHTTWLPLLGALGSSTPAETTKGPGANLPTLDWGTGRVRHLRPRCVPPLTTVVTSGIHTCQVSPNCQKRSSHCLTYALRMTWTTEQHIRRQSGRGPVSGQQGNLAAVVTTELRPQ